MQHKTEVITKSSEWVLTICRSYHTLSHSTNYCWADQCFLFVKIEPYVEGPTETHFTTSFILLKNRSFGRHYSALKPVRILKRPPFWIWASQQ